MKMCSSVNVEHIFYIADYQRNNGISETLCTSLRKRSIFFGNNASTLDKNLRLSPLRATAAPKLMLRGGGILVLEQETSDEVIGVVYAGGVESSKINTGGAL